MQDRDWWSSSEQEDSFCCTHPTCLGLNSSNKYLCTLCTAGVDASDTVVNWTNRTQWRKQIFENEYTLSIPKEVWNKKYPQCQTFLSTPMLSQVEKFTPGLRRRSWGTCRSTNKMLQNYLQGVNKWAEVFVAEPDVPGSNPGSIWWLEFYPWSLRAGRRELTPINCLLTSMSAPCPVYVCTHSQNK